MTEKSLFRALRGPYYIVAPNYISQSAGIRATHYLCHALNEMGEEAYVTSDVRMPYLRTPRLTKSVRRQHEESGREPIIVYPEVVSGNPLDGHIVARWLLNKPGHLSGDKIFDDHDMIFVYSGQFAPENIRVEYLYIPTVDQSIFNNDNNPDNDRRNGRCFYAHKYLVKGGKLTKHVENATSLCLDTGMTQHEIAQILRRSELLYVYEPTALIQESLLCGCPVSVVVTDYWKSNTNNSQCGRGHGIIFDDNPESLEFAKNTVSSFIDQYNAGIKSAWDHIANFVDLTQARYREFLHSAHIAHLSPPSTTCTPKDDYTLWRLGHCRQGISLIQNLVKLPDRPFFHIFLLVFPAKESVAFSSITSLQNQNYAHWRVSILATTPLPCGLALPTGNTWQNIAEIGFMEAINKAASKDQSNWFCFMAAGDQLETHALLALSQGMTPNPDWSVLYTDEDNVNGDGSFTSPFFKPDFNPDLFRSAPFVANGLLAIKRELLISLGGLQPDKHGAEFYDLILRAYENLGEAGIGHIADILYHRNADGEHLMPEYLSAARHKVLQEHLGRIGAVADIEEGVIPGTFHIRHHHGGEVSVSIIIPTLNGGAILQSSVNAVVENTEFKNWELIVVDQESDDADTLVFLDYLRSFNNDAVRVISQPRSSCWPALRNAGANEARQDYLLFLSDATQPLQSDWLDEMLGYAVQPGVGVVGAKAVGADGKVSNAGYILGLGGQPAGFHHLHVPLDDPGYFGRLQVPGNPSAVPFSCMLTKKKLFDELGGFDEHSLAAGYSDVDYCLKVGKANHRVVWTPFALMFQPHKTEPPKEVEVDDDDDDAEKQRSRILPGPTAQVMFDRWLDRIAFDPAYNRNLSLSLATSESYIKGFEIETLPSLSWDPDIRPVPRILAFFGGGEAREEHRISAPMRALVSTAMVQGADSSEYLSIPELARMSPDVLIFQHNQQGHQPKLIESYAHNFRAFRIFELDVLLSNTQIYQDNGLADTLNLSDRLVVPTEYLAHEYRKFSSEIHVVPDYIERAKWGSLTPQRRQGRKPRVGWAGSAIHEADLALIADVVKALQEEVEWVFLGLCPEGTRAMVEYHGGVVNSAYPSRLASLNLDLALSPLKDMPSNHAESPLRLLEYGVLGYPVICTDITPYRGSCPVTRVTNRRQDWIDAIREHVSDMDELARRGDALRKHVNENWILEDHLDTWLNAWLPSHG